MSSQTSFDTWNVSITATKYHYTHCCCLGDFKLINSFYRQNVLYLYKIVRFIIREIGKLDLKEMVVGTVYTNTVLSFSSILTLIYKVQIILRNIMINGTFLKILDFSFFGLCCSQNMLSIKNQGIAHSILFIEVCSKLWLSIFFSLIVE